MALDKSKMESGFKKLFDINSSPPSSEADCAKQMANIIIKYLGDVKIGALSAPGVFPPPAGPGPDPSFNPSPMSSITPVDANKSMIEGGLKAAMETNRGGPEGKPAPVKSGWSKANTGFQTYVVSTFIAFQHGGYIAAGATIPGSINLGSILSSESEDSVDVAKKLASHIHDYFTGCKFTGGYLKGSFVGPAPHSSNLK